MPKRDTPKREPRKAPQLRAPGDPVQCPRCSGSDIGYYVAPKSKKKLWGCRTCKQWRHVAD